MTANPPDLSAQLARLADMCDSGALTLDEFRAAKAQLLAAPQPQAPPAWAAPAPAWAAAGRTTLSERPTGFAMSAPWVLVVSIAAAMLLGPLVLAVVDSSATSGTAVWSAIVAGWVAWAIVAYFDRRALRRETGGAQDLVALFGGWAYLLARAIRLRNGVFNNAWNWVAVPVLLIIQVALIAVAPSITSATANATASMTLNVPKLEQGITKWLKNTSLTPTGPVHCPSLGTVHVGAKFICTVRIQYLGQTSVQVTVASTTEVSWRLL